MEKKSPANCLDLSLGKAGELSVWCAVCTGTSVCMQSACVFFLPLMYRHEVCLVSVYMARMCPKACVKTGRQSSRLGSPSGIRPQASRQNECLNTNPGEEGRKGGPGLGAEKMHHAVEEDGPGRRRALSFD